jgi:hypothetical protein
MRPFFLLSFFLLGCATSNPRFTQELATSFAQDDMRKLTTETLEVYYPAQHREVAERIARRAAQCIDAMRTQEVGARPPQRALLFLTSANFNNAYVTGQFLGEPLHSVNPLQTSLELLHWYGLSGADAADVSCHEMFHYVHFDHLSGFWRVLNTVTGPVVSSQIFLERWFTEGVAQYYEGRIERTVGRPHSPLYRGAFESFVASRNGAISPGDLNSNQRELFPYSGAYLTSLPFVEWLIEQHGEEAVWRLIDRQGRDFLAPLAVSLRFRSEFGASLGSLVDQWAEHLKNTIVQRRRPASQVVVREQLGQLARLAVHGPTGTMALIQSGNDEVPMLRILESDGRVRAEARLVRLRFGREWVLVGPITMSGLSFSADGRFLFLMNEDLVSVGDTRTQLWKIDASNGEVLRVWQEIGRGQGGTILPSGKQYLFVDFAKGRSRLATFDLETEKVSVVYEAPTGVGLSAPAVSPNGRQTVFSRLDGNGWNLWLKDEEGAVRPLTTDGAFNYGAKWFDDDRLSLPRIANGRLQVHRLTVSTGTIEQLTQAPWTLLDAWPTRDSIVFINRDQTQWSLDRAPASPFGAVTTTDNSAMADTAPPVVAAETSASPSPNEPPPLPEAPALVEAEDEAYSSLDHLFFPQLRVPGVTVLPEFVPMTNTIRWNTTLYASLSGRDRLGRHNWAINGSFVFPRNLWSLSLEYRNLQLAPWQIGVFASRDAFLDGAFWSGALSVSRSFFTVPLSFGTRALVNETFDPSAPSRFERYIGPEVSVSYAAGETTAYGGAQRLLSLSARAAAYPIVFGSDRSLVDVRGSVAVALPLPFTQRHSFVLSAAGRGLPGAPRGTLRVGGQPQGFSLFQSVASAEVPQGPGAYLPGTLAEAVRGYDDFTIRTEGVGLAGARYRYSFIIDRGTASILWIFPSFFARQVDVEAFGSGALTLQGEWLRAAGAAASFRFTLMDAIPVSLSYQFAWRFDFTRGGLHTVSLALE